MTVFAVWAHLGSCRTQTLWFFNISLKASMLAKNTFKMTISVKLKHNWLYIIRDFIFGGQTRESEPLSCNYDDCSFSLSHLHFQWCIWGFVLLYPGSLHCHLEHNTVTYLLHKWKVKSRMVNKIPIYWKKCKAINQFKPFKVVFKSECLKERIGKYFFTLYFFS